MQRYSLSSSDSVKIADLNDLALQLRPEWKGVVPVSYCQVGTITSGSLAKCLDYVARWLKALHAIPSVEPISHWSIVIDQVTPRHLEIAGQAFIGSKTQGDEPWGYDTYANIVLRRNGSDSFSLYGSRIAAVHRLARLHESPVFGASATMDLNV